MRLGPCVTAALLVAALCDPLQPARADEPAADGWRPFTGTCTLSGERQLLPTEGGRPASIVHLSGSMAILSGEGLGRGFLVEMIGFDDGAALLIGRTVLTDEHGNRIYSTLKAEPIGTGRRATGTIAGGSGRYAGVEGSFTYTGEYAVDSGSGEISVRAVDLEGRIRHAPPAGREAPR